jgi:hypothetical protein
MPHILPTPRLLASLAMLAATALIFCGSAFASPPSNTSNPVVSGTPAVGRTLTSTYGIWSGSTPMTLLIQWQRCPSTTAGTRCYSISGATTSSYTATSSDVGYGLRTVVSATNTDGSATSWAVRTAPVTAPAVVDPANTGLPTISGTAEVGKSLTATSGTWTGTVPMTYSYQWQRSDSTGTTWTGVTGATGTTYLLGSADAARRLRVVVTAANAVGTTSATSAATAIVTTPVVAPASTAAPAVTGTAQQGSTLTASTGSWSGTAPMSYAYQWQRCDSAGASCASIAGATGSTLVLGSADVNRRLRVSVTASNAGGSSTAFSLTTTTVTAVTSTPPPGPSGSSVVLTDKSWTCTGSVNIDLLKITMQNGSDNAVYLKSGCTGYIGRIEVDTWHQDGVKVWGGAHDLVLGGGYISCHARDASVHQDGVQVQAGDRITFRGVTIDCPTSNNAAFFVSATTNTPTDIVCDGCTLKPANSTVNIKTSLRSGVRNSIVCRGQTAGIRIQDGAVDPINVGNSELPASDSRCTSTA